MKTLAAALALSLSAAAVLAEPPPAPVSTPGLQSALTSPDLPPGYKYASINKFGYNVNIQAVQELVWTGSTTYNYPSSAVVMTIVSTDEDDDGDPVDTGARTVQIFCLDTNGDPFSETLTLNGVGAVSMATACLRVYRAKVITAGSTGSNEGTLTIANGGTTYGEIEVGSNQTLQAAYTCPAATRCVVEWVTVASDDNVEFEMLARPTGEVFRPSFRHQTNAEETQSTWWSCVPALADIECRAVSLSGIAEVGCSFRVHHFDDAGGACG